jgi:hypothetical protein
MIKEYPVRFEVLTVVTMKNAIFWDGCYVALVRPNILEEHITSIIRVKGIIELVTMLAVTSN